MQQGEWFLYVLIFAPAALGLAALVGGLMLLVPIARKKEKEEGKSDTARMVAGVILLVFALGVGLCYGTMFGLGRGL